MSETLSLKEGAELLGYRTKEPIERLIRAGELSAMPLTPGGRRRLYRKQINELLERRMRGR